MQRTNFTDVYLPISLNLVISISGLPCGHRVFCSTDLYQVTNSTLHFRTIGFNNSGSGYAYDKGWDTQIYYLALGI